VKSKDSGKNGMKKFERAIETRGKRGRVKKKDLLKRQ